MIDRPGDFLEQMVVLWMIPCPEGDGRPSKARKCVPLEPHPILYHPLSNSVAMQTLSLQNKVCYVRPSHRPITACGVEAGSEDLLYPPLAPQQSDPSSHRFLFLKVEEAPCPVWDWICEMVTFQCRSSPDHVGRMVKYAEGRLHMQKIFCSNSKAVLIFHSKRPH